MKKILITNDDGFAAHGINALRDELEKNLKDCEIFVVAPAGEKSACAHSLTLTRPLHMLEVAKNFYKVDDGTPSDCVYLALNTIFKDKKPDLVISGVNIGSNMGEDVTYSGTCAGAMEACIYDIPSFAISQVISDKKLDKSFDYALACEFATTLARKILDNGMPLEKRKFLNVNIPQLEPKNCKGVQITQLGYRLYSNDVRTNRNPRGNEYFWLGLHPLRWEKRTMSANIKFQNLDSENLISDFDATQNGYISITPIKLDLTSYEDFQNLGDFLK